MWIAAFFVGVLIGGVIMAVLAAASRTDEAEAFVLSVEKERLAAYARGYKDGTDDMTAGIGLS